jgi:hypothetical protein
MASERSQSRASNFYLGSTVYGIAILAMNIALGVAALAALWILGGMIWGALPEFGALTVKADRVRLLENVRLAQQALTYGLGIASLCAAFVYFTEETIGYLLLVGAAIIGLGIPFAYTTFGGTTGSNYAMQLALGSFYTAARLPFMVGAALIVWDIGKRFVSALQSKELVRDNLKYGGSAQQEKRPVRINLLGKCWEGPYCREFVRVHCPIYQARAACWKLRRGCYCEEDIVSAAADKVSGVKLEMAPDPRYNVINAPTINPVRKVELSPAQKRERCRHCIIYEEHQREKYRVVMPIALVGTLVLCAMFSPLLREVLSSALGGVESLVARLSFFDAKTTAANVKFQKPTQTAEWILIGAISLMIVSKVLQTVEWAIFKLKI